MAGRAMVRAGLVAAAAGLVLAGWSAPALAHVSVNPEQATQGGYAKLTFRVPNERDGVATVKLEVVVPTDTPIASVSVRPLAGWTATVERITLPEPVKTDDGEVTEGVSKITWTAANSAAGVQPGEFQEFDISAGPLPEVDQIVFKALQTYSDQQVVRWIEEPSGTGEEPENPAPVLKLAPAQKDGSAEAADGGTALTSDTAAQESDKDSDGSGWGVGLGAAGLVIALLSLGLAGLAWRRGGQPAAAVPSTSKADRAG